MTEDAPCKSKRLAWTLSTVLAGLLIYSLSVPWVEMEIANKNFPMLERCCEPWDWVLQNTPLHDVMWDYGMWCLRLRQRLLDSSPRGHAAEGH